MGIFRRLLSATGGEVRPFKFTLRITSANTLYELPLTSPGGDQPNIAVDWGDSSGSTTITVEADDRFGHGSPFLLVAVRAARGRLVLPFGDAPA